MPRATDAQPTLAALLRHAAEKALELARVAIPAVVVSFDAAKATCSAQPLIRCPLPDGGETSDPALAAVPVLYPGTATSRVRFPLAKGDTVLLVFLDRAADEWALSLLLPEATAPKEKSPAERRFHDFTDAVAIPIATASPADRPVETDRMSLQHGDVTIDLTDSGLVQVHDGTAAQAVELATKADLATLKAAITSAAVVAMDGGAALKANILASLTSWPAGTTVLRGK